MQTDNQDLVSIIVPVYNGEQYIRRCMDSLIKQTYPNIEIILINDGSKDNSGVILDEYASIYEYVLVYHKQNEGVSSARNDGIAMSHGKYIVFVDSDDEVTINYVAKLMKYKEFDYVTSGFQQQLSTGEFKTVMFPETNTTIEEIKLDAEKYMGKYYFGSPWGKLFKAELIRKHNIKFPYDIKSGEDTYFIFEYLEYCDTVKISSDIEYLYYFYENSLVHTVHPQYWEWKIKVEQKIDSFFDFSKEDNEMFLNQRNFEVLIMLLSMYEKGMSEKQLKEIYKVPFFENALMWGKNSHVKSYELLAFMLRINKYKWYVLFMRIINKLRGVK